MKLTGFAKFFITLVILGAVGYVGWYFYGDKLRTTGNPEAAQDRALMGRLGMYPMEMKGEE